MWQRRAVGVAVVLLVYSAVMTVVAVAVGWPSQFDNPDALDASTVGEQWPGKGTAVSAPLVPLVILTVAAAFVALRGRLAGLGLVLMALLGVVFVVATFGEITAEPTDDVSRAVLVGFGIVGVALSAALSFTAVRGLLERRR